MIPVFILYAWRENEVNKDMIVLVFTFVFAIFLAIFTRAKRHKVFAATAGYVSNFHGKPSFSVNERLTIGIATAPSSSFSLAIPRLYLSTTSKATEALTA